MVTAAYEKILFTATQGESVTKQLAAWIKAHPKHAKVAEARAKLVDAYLNETKLAAAPDEGSPLSKSDAAALAVAGQILAETFSFPISFCSPDHFHFPRQGISMP